MKKRAKVLSAILTVVLSVSLMGTYVVLAHESGEPHEEPVQPIEQAGPAEPIPSTGSKDISGWASADIKWMVDQGLVPPELQGNYKSNITREDYARLANIVLAKLVGGRSKIEKVYNTHIFKDTTDPAVYSVFTFGVVNGVSDAEFQPKRNIERKEAVMMMGNIMRTLKLSGLGYEKAPYVDYSAIPVWARPSADITYNAKIFQGTSAGMEPDKPYTREQSIVTMKRLIDFAKDVEGISYRGKIFVKIDSVSVTKVGTNFVKIGLEGDSKTVTELWSTVSDNFEGASLTGVGKEKVTSGIYTIETLGDDYQIKISW